MRILCQRSGHKPGTGRIEHEELAAKDSGNRFQHLFCPLGMLLGLDTVLYDRTEKRVSRCRTKRIVPDFPILRKDTSRIASSSKVGPVSRRCVNLSGLGRIEGEI